MNLAELKVRDAPGWTIFIFGALAVALGALGLARPEATLSLLGFETLERSVRAAGDFTVVFLTASSMASFNMGIYYVLAALTNTRQFYLWTVPFRTLTFIVFSLAALTGTAPMGFIGVALWELAGAVATGLALFLDSRKKV